jgi:hypothetical protein
MPQNAVIAATGGDYTSLQAWITAEAAFNYGAPTRCYISGIVPAGAITLFTKGTNNWPNGAEIRAIAGQEYNGTNLATCARITHTSSVIEVGDAHFDMQGIYLDVTGGFNNKTFRFAADYPTTVRRNVTIKKCAIASSPNYHGATTTIYLSLVSTNPNSQYHLDFEDIVVIPRASNNGIGMAAVSGSLNISGTIKRVTVIPTNSGTNAKDSLSLGSGSACTVAVSSILALGSEGRTNYIDYVNSGFAGTVANVVTADGTGTITGATTATQLENFAGGDYRLKTSSHGFGAFPQSAGTVQAIESGGTVATTRSGAAISTIAHDQAANASAIAATTRSGTAASTVDNAQSVEASAVVAATRSGVAISEIANAQAVDASGAVNAVRSGTVTAVVTEAQEIAASAAAGSTRDGVAASEWLQVQLVDASGVVAINRGGIATSVVVNELSDDQVIESGGTATATRSGNAVSTIIQTQVFEASGSVDSTRGGVAASQVVNEFTVVQNVESGGAVSIQRGVNAATQIDARQEVSASAVASITRSGVVSSVAFESTTAWSAPTVLFNEPEPIKQISLSFDQLGRPVVFYRVGDDTLKLYWYDPVQQAAVLTVLTTGIDPTAQFDYPHDTGKSFTDILLFYVRDNAIYMRIQRDRFAVEYATPVAGERLGVNIVSAGFRSDNRFQVEYRAAAECPVDPAPMPTVVVVGKGYYRNSWGSCLKSNYALNVVNDPFKLGFAVRDAFYPRYHEKPLTQGAFKQGQYMFGCDAQDGRRQFYCYIERDTRNSSAIINLWRGGRELSALFVLDDFNGEWEFHFNGLSPVVAIYKDGQMILNEALATPDPGKAAVTPITFAGAVYPNSVDSYPFHGAVYNCWIEHNNNRTDWAVNSKGQEAQPSVPEGTDMTILNHRAQNWIFK